MVRIWDSRQRRARAFKCSKANRKIATNDYSDEAGEETTPSGNRCRSQRRTGIAGLGFDMYEYDQDRAHEGGKDPAIGWEFFWTYPDTTVEHKRRRRGRSVIKNPLNCQPL